MRRALPDTAQSGTKAYEEPLAESYADAWSYLDQWAIHGQALFAINALAQKQSTASGTTLATAAPLPKAATSSTVRR